MFQLKKLSVLLLSMVLIGCVKGPATPSERERAREVLNETSPRNLNEHPKAVPEFKTSFPFKRGSH
jgi:PBP1b-binding outer membrane lipoprotein LpoB